MTDKAKELLSVCVQKIIDDNLPQFEDILMNGVNSDMSRDDIYVHMMLNSIRLSVDISTQIVCELLDGYNVIPFKSDDKEIQKQLLRIRTENLQISPAQNHQQ